MPYLRIMREGLRYTLTHPSLRALIVLRAVVMTAGMAGIIFIQPFLRSFDVSVGDFGWLTTPNSLAAIGGALIAHRLVTRLGERRVIFMNGADIVEHGLVERQLVDLISEWHDGERVAESFIVVPYDLPRRNCATYFPEANPLVPLDSYADRSQTPTSKSVVIRIRPRA